MMRCLLALAVIGSLPGIAAAQWLELESHDGGVGGTGWFSINDQRKFLVFVSYFDALDVGYNEFSADLQYLKDRGVDGVRIMPNWWTAPRLYASGNPLQYAQDTLFQPDGSLRAVTRDHLYEYLNRAKQAGVVVDLSFSPETVSSNENGGGPTALTWEAYKTGLRQITVALRDRGDRHVMFDIANEGNINGPCNSVTPPSTATCRGMVPNVNDYGDLAAFVAELKALDPTRVITMSTDQGYNDSDATLPRTRSEQLGLMATTWHDDRVGNWYNNYATHMNNLHGSLPVYFQEPTPWGTASSTNDGPLNTDTWQNFITAVTGAKAAGAAAWCYHTRASFRMNGGSLTAPLTMSTTNIPWYDLTVSGGRLRPGERTFFDNLKPSLDATGWGVTLPGGITSPATSYTDYRTYLRTYNNYWTVAENGGGGVTQANRTSPSLWETFYITDLNGDWLLTGDKVTLRTYDNVHYVQAANGGGAGTNATPNYWSLWETFTIEKLNGSPNGLYPPKTRINQGDPIALRSHLGYYLVAENGGGGAWNANRTSPWLWEIFYLTMW